MTELVSRPTQETMVRTRPARILIVEDESVVAMDLEEQLRGMGYEVCCCVNNSHDAIRRTRSDHPDLILMDIVIKGEMDGIDTAEFIERTFGIPIVFLTAYSDDTTVRRAARAAPYGYLTKPFQSSELHAGLEVALYKSTLEKRLRDSEQWFAATLRCVGDGVIATDPQGRVRFMNPVAQSLVGWDLSEACGRDVNEVFRVENMHDSTPLPSPVQRALADDVVIGMEFGSMLIARNGRRLPIDDSAAPIRNEQGEVLGGVMVFRDVHERLEAEERLRQSEEHFRSAFNFAPVGMAIVGLDNHFLQVNDAICNLLEVSESELVGVDQATFSYRDEAEGERRTLYELLAGKVVSAQYEKRFRSKSGKEIWTLVSASLLHKNDQPFCFLYQVNDVTKRKEAERRIAHLAHFDSLTGLANRALLNEKIEGEIAAARRHRRGLAVAFIDLDHFKEINDSLGHEAGDELLQGVAARLRASVRQSDTVGRLGGDEFVILLPEIRCAEDVLVVMDKVQTECAKPFHIASHEMRLGISLGVSLFPDDAQDSRTLLRYADSALYHAKAEGRNHLQFYRPELTARMEERMRLGAGLRGALERDEFELYYQPIISLQDGVTHGAEALIRWHHPDLGILTPDSFIVLAEEMGLSNAIGEWVIGEACRQAATWNAESDQPMRVSVNVSASQFRSGKLAGIIRDALAVTGLEPRCLCVEITEQGLLPDNDKNQSIITDLKSLGVHVAIDDFGTGYSSLSTISQFQPTELKIDRSLISGISATADSREYALVTAAIAMAHALKLESVMEGVETEAQQTFLQEQGCLMAQGFYYAHPFPAPEFRTWLHKAQTRAQ